MEAWVTSVSGNDHVASALVLAESLRKTRTQRKLCVISSDQVGNDYRKALRKVFDHVWVINLSTFSLRCDDHLRPKLFALLCLDMFSKCVYLSSASIVVENADEFFEDDKSSLKSLWCKTSNGPDLSFFFFKSERTHWESIWEIDGTVTDAKLNEWLQKQTSLKVDRFPDDSVARFSIKSGQVEITKLPTHIFQFVETTRNLPEELENMQQRIKPSLVGEVVVGTWMEIFLTKVIPVLRNPSGSPSHRETLATSLNDDYENDPIAIVGMSCRYPGANSLEEFWNLLYQGDDAIREPPAFRWTKEHTPRKTGDDKRTKAGFLSIPVDEFDSKFFGVSPKEAVFMDPQARILHEVMWESLEDAGIDPLSLRGSHTGIFAGSWMNDYRDISLNSPEIDFFRMYMGNGIGATAARLSFLLGLTGPSIATESGCSSAIVALDLAVKSLRLKECNLAIATGVNLILHPFSHDLMNFVIAKDGRCKTFDENADGFGRAEGCGVLVLRRLSDALRNRDHIWGIIRGSAVSQEGLSKSLGSPTVHCEALAMQLALKDANIKPEQVDYVETHGTGTPVGDPMEVAAITKAYRAQKREKPLLIGSVKTNVGHTESCSGITGIMKVILSMEHELIPKHLNLDKINPEIFLDSIPAAIPMENISWPKVPGQPRLAGVSSFGITGTDGHVIIQEAPDYSLPKLKFPLERPLNLMKISAKSKEALEELLESYKNIFADKLSQTSDDFSDFAYSANIGRADFNHRCVVSAYNFESALNALEENKCLRAELPDSSNNTICFLFTGQGSQYPDMAKNLYETSPIFRFNFDACDNLLSHNYGISIKPVLWESSEELSRTIYSQVSIFCVEYCLWKLWTSWGVQPDYVLGHSLGEFCAAVAAGYLDFKDAIKLVAERSRLIDNLPRGKMLVVKESKQQVLTMLSVAKLKLDLAADNTPEQTVVAGDSEKILLFQEFLKNQGTKCVVLEATHAFHSTHMNPVLEEYRKVAETVFYKRGNGFTQYISGMQGRIISEMTPEYWVRHTREQVSFVDACKTIQETGCAQFLEVGPHPVLSTFVMINNDICQPTCLPSLRKGASDWQTLLTSLGKLYLSGYQVDWKAFDQPYSRNKVSLPFHPFARKSYWVDCSGAKPQLIHPLIGTYINNASSCTIFENDITCKAVPYLKDHLIGSRIVFPGAGYIEMCLTAGYCMANGLVDALEPPRHAMKLTDFKIDAPMELKEGKRTRVQVIVDLPQEDSQGFRVKVFHQNTSNEGDRKWFSHAAATFVALTTEAESLKSWDPSRIDEIISSGKVSGPESLYKGVEEVGLKLGGQFRSIKQIWSSADEEELVTELDYPPDLNKYVLHPIVIDAVFQSAMLTQVNKKEAKFKVPVRVGQLTIFPVQIPIDSLYIHVKCVNEQFYVYIAAAYGDGTYVPVAYLEDIELLQTNVHTIEAVLEQQSSNISDAYEEIWKVIPSPFSSFIDPLPLEVFKKIPKNQEIQAVQQQASGSEDDLVLESERQQLNQLYILNALYELNWDPLLHQTWTVKSFCTQLGIKENFHKLVRFILSTVLTEYFSMGLKNEEETWTISAAPPIHQHVKLEMNRLGALLKSRKKSELALIDENMGLHYSRILNGEISPLELLFPTDEAKLHLSADAFYNSVSAKEHLINICGKLCEIILEESFRHNSGNDGGKVIRVLEVGAGTGALTEYLLKQLRVTWGDRFEFYYTDISKGFFGKAEKRFEEYKENIKFEVFDLEKSPLGQQIPLNYFDIVSAVDVLHATRSLQETLAHLRQTLRPGGMIIFIETIVENVNFTWIFGLLEGYWRFTDLQTRSHHCCVGPEVWGKVLHSTGYEEVHCYKVFMEQYGCFTAYAAPDFKVESLSGFSEEETHKRWIVFADEDNFDAGKMVVDRLEMSGYHVTCVVRNKQLEGGNIKAIKADLEDSAELEPILADDSKGKLEGIIYTWGMNQQNRNQETVALPFLHIAKHLATLSNGPMLFVVTQGVHGAVTDDSLVANPTPATLFGMAKALRNESHQFFIRIIDLEQHTSPRNVVDQVLYELVNTKGSKEQQRMQVAYRSGVRYEPRFTKCSLQTKNDELKLPVGTDRYKLILPESKLIQDLTYGLLEEEPIGDEEVEVKVHAYALNFKDVLTVIKPSEEFEKLNQIGIDFAGVVTKAGKASPFTAGESVFGANNNPVQLPSHLVVDMRTLIRTPKELTPSEACTLPAVFATAYHCLIKIARMKKGETVLIHTASGGVGLAAIQLANQVGAKVIATAGNPRKRAYLRNLGVEDVFHSRDTSYEAEIIRVTNGKGVDIVLNSITGPGFKEATLNVCAEGARFIEMSVLSKWTKEEVKARRPDVDYSIVYLADMKTEDWGDLLINLKDYLENGKLKPIPYVKFDSLNIRQALQYLQKAKHIGKVVVAMAPVTREGGELQLKVKAPLFNSDSSYLITGGLGGIGFEVCKWMLENGATNVVLNGRRPPSEVLSRQIEDLNHKGANVTVQLGDVGDYDQCKAIIESFEDTKPLRGIMHCAGVLRDNVYSSMTWEHFQTSFQPKVVGSWNLHDLTRNHLLEHFVVYSSITALLGTMSQANHAAANCFEDALVHHRHSLGLPGTTINWGQWAEVGVAKEIFVPGFVPVSTKRMLNGLEAALRTQRRQVCLSEFDGFTNLGIMCPLAKGYIHDRLWNQATPSSQLITNMDANQFWTEMDAVTGKEEKVGVMIAYLKVLLKAGLRMEPEDPLGDDANLQECGVDSLMMIELKNSIQTLVGSRVAVTANLLKNATTVRLVADAVVTKLMDESGEEPLTQELSSEELLDLLKEDSILSEEIRGLGNPPKPSQIKTVLVTGATGWVGAHVVSAITQNYPEIERIVCLVKRKAKEGTREKVKSAFESWKLTEKVDMNKLEFVEGNVSSANLGVAEVTYSSLCNSVEAIFHCAFNSNKKEAYRKADSDNIRQVNVVGTVNILKFATQTKQKLVFYPSTILASCLAEVDSSIISEEGPEMDILDTVVSHKIPSLFATKLVSELLLKQASERSVPCKVFRFPMVAGHRQTGHLDYNNNIYILRYLSYLKLGAMSEAPVPANVLPVDICTEISLRLFFNDDSPWEVYNVCHPSPPVEQEFVQVAANEFGKDIKILDLLSFNDLLNNQTETNEELSALIKQQVNFGTYTSDIMVLAKGYISSPETYFHSHKLSKYIPNYDQIMIPVMETIKRDIKNLIAIGVTKQLGI